MGSEIGDVRGDAHLGLPLLSDPIPGADSSPVKILCKQKVAESYTLRPSVKLDDSLKIVLYSLGKHVFAQCP